MKCLLLNYAKVNNKYDSEIQHQMTFKNTYKNKHCATYDSENSYKQTYFLFIIIDYFKK